MHAFLTLLLLLVSVCGSAQARAEMQVQVLMSSDAPPYQQALDGFRKQLANTGHMINYQVAVANNDQRLATQQALASTGQPSMLTLCLGSLSCKTVQQVRAQYDSGNLAPLLASMITDEQAITDTSTTTGIYLNFLPETQLREHAARFPALRRIGVLYNPGNSGTDIEIARQVAWQTGLELIAVAVESPRQLPTALKKLLRQIDVLWAYPDRSVLNAQTAREVMLASFRNRIPVIGSSSSWTHSGALYSLDRNYADIGAQVADMASRIFAGESVSSITPIEPRWIGYTLNQKSADHMRIRLDSTLLKGAVEVFR